MGPPHGPPMDMPSPEEVIKTLPKALQGDYSETLEAQHTSGMTHMKAELEMLKSVLKTLEATKRYLPKATKEEQKAIAGALMFFEQMGPHEGPPMGPGGPPGPPTGMGPGGPMPMGPPGHPPGDMDAKGLVGKMLKDVGSEVEHIQQKLKEMEMHKPGGSM